MGSSRKPSKKTPASLEEWNLYEYTPVFKKRKLNRTITPTFFAISKSDDLNKPFFLGTIIIGTTHNVFPENYNFCKICFKTTEGDDRSNSLILNCDESHLVVNTIVDAYFLKEIVLSKAFALDLRTNEDEILLDIYFSSLPVPKFNTRIGNIIKWTFQLLYKIETNTAKDESPTKYKKLLHGNTEIMNLYDKLLAARGNKFSSSDTNIQHQFLKPLLRPYQIEAVQWMLHQEKYGAIQKDTLHPLYMPVTLKSGITIYYDKFNGYVVQEKVVISNIIRGGILADEMGLGKTVEVLACILANSGTDFAEKTSEDTVYPTIQIFKKSKLCIDNNKIGNEYTRNSENVPDPLNGISEQEKTEVVPKETIYKNKSANYIALNKWYHETLNKVSTLHREKKTNRNSFLIQCVCGRTSQYNTVKCTTCEKYQHESCLGFKKEFGPYICPQCWMKQPIFDCQGTLIVTPVSLKAQWCKEISKHIVGKLKVLVYDGFSTTPIYPTNLKNYDIVITTYNVLQNELYLIESNKTFSFRNERKYSSPGCPLTRVKWRRICLDEAQAVDSPAKKVSEMVSKINACFRWAVTGTPISKNISDLFGLVDYLQITPYNDYTTWKNILYHPYMNGNEKPMIDFLSDVLWRTAKANVTDQINIPKQSLKEHILEFSAVEKYFYNREHEMSAAEFLSRVTKYDPALPLQNLDRSKLKKILAPLSALRHACTYPNTVKGKYLITKKKVRTMKDLLNALISKNHTDSEECLRAIASALNGLAGIHLLLQDAQQSINFYREVLQLSARFSGKQSDAKISVDKLLVIHAMHNLAEVLEIHRPNEPTLRDETLRDDCVNLEKKYMEKFENETLSAYESFCVYSNSIQELQKQNKLVEGQWYSDGFNWIVINDYLDELKERLQTACDHAALEFNSRNESERTLLQKACLWYDDIFDSRTRLFKAIEVLYEEHVLPYRRITIKERIVQNVTDCHLRPNKKAKNTKKCAVCVSNENLQRYEGILFSMIQRKEMSLIGSWKPTIPELIFKSTLSILKLKYPDSKYIADGEIHIKIIDGLKKEFKELRRFWTFLDRQICAQDEMDICKIRLQLKELSTEEEQRSAKRNNAVKNLSYTIEAKHENVNLLSVHELDYQDTFLRNEVTINTDKLEKLMGTQNYLETLRKQQYEGLNPDPCPICKNSLDQHWSILLCGHTYCMECIQTCLEQAFGEYITCSVCRNKQKIQEISYLKSGNNIPDDEDAIRVKGNFSTKVEAVISLLLDLKSKDPCVKILLFSFWVSVLKNLKEALLENDIKCELLYNSALESRIENFKDVNKEITVLLLPINLGSKGLNLIEATHVILVEPLLNPADELQAIGRIHRIGQTKPTFVHKFFVKNTIEESIHQATTSNAEKWDQSKVTLQNLIQLFTDSEEASNNESNQANLPETAE